MGNAFLPVDEAAAAAVAAIERLAAEEGLASRLARRADLGPDIESATHRACMPHFRQLFVAAGEGRDRPASAFDLERRAFCLRKRVEHAAGVYFPSLSPRTIVYKGMLTEPQVVAFYPDLADERVPARWRGAHSRLSTNTFPAWPLATRTATSPITARSTRCAATGTGWPPARAC